MRLCERRAWYALWAFVFAIAVLIWLIIVCAVCHWSRRHNG
uniref:Envelope glycoprotein n=1 Tax=Globodera pallida TaxID=36090 RepID=A0A183CSF0_GLOPA